MRQLSAVLALALVLGAAACMSAPSATPLTSAEAVDLVLAQNELFAGLAPRDPELIGQAAWYEVSESDDGWRVEIRMGWGDCPAGCINEHRWTYAVSSTGDVDLVEESGDPIPAESGVSGTVTAGPTCPVVTDPPDPSCADRPVEGAVLVVTTLAGVEVDWTTSDAEGRFALSLAPGHYRLEPQPVEGLMGTAAPVEFTVDPGAPALDLVIGYDTGIR
ncbi:MAG: carboxypeptidase-like regulatory domain-containing protein [Chloroflexota bacterium]|nr:carboxypeptidase-like regulatory domain-containing protein [Chloroflexota bacterium]